MIGLPRAVRQWRGALFWRNEMKNTIWMLVFWLAVLAVCIGMIGIFAERSDADGGGCPVAHGGEA